MTTAVLVAAVVTAFLVGASLQRIAGLGLGLVVAPMLTLLLGPAVGVTLSNAGAVVTTLLVLRVMRKDVDWRAFARLAPLVVLGSIVGAFVVLRMDGSWLEVLIGSLILLALGLTLAVGGRIHLRGRRVAAVAGALGGFMNTTAGVAGPAMTVYAVATRWGQTSFAATLQPILLLANVSSLISKSLVGAVPADIGLPWWIWPVVAASVATGVGVGGFLSSWVDIRLARRVAVGIAGLGGIVTLLRGLTGI
ncbi:MAG: sulfite exporter TauE/SafE family protein [Ornithinimicrobium sp.]